jgi:hypothetical protein
VRLLDMARELPLKLCRRSSSWAILWIGTQAGSFEQALQKRAKDGINPSRPPRASFQACAWFGKKGFSSIEKMKNRHQLTPKRSRQF